MGEGANIGDDARAAEEEDVRLTTAEGSLYDREFWGVQRHELVGGAAERLLSDGARAAVAEILGPVQPGDLADIAGWADDIKRPQGQAQHQDQDTLDFLADVQNKGHGDWHFVNLPLGAEEYSREKYPTLTRDEDVVQMIGEAARVLMGDSNRMSRLNALRWIVHLVGDVHQPVHVGCSYLEKVAGETAMVFDPTDIVERGLRHDLGGNRILLPVGGQRGTSLHSYWDSRLAVAFDRPRDDAEGEGDDDAPGGQSDAVAAADRDLRGLFVDKLYASILASRGPLPAGAASDEPELPPDRWAEQWATASLIAARSAYQSLAIKGPNQKKPNSFDVTWEGKEAYDARCKPIVQRRLETAAQNLAALLNAIL